MAAHSLAPHPIPAHAQTEIPVFPGFPAVTFRGLQAADKPAAFSRADLARRDPARSAPSPTRRPSTRRVADYRSRPAARGIARTTRPRWPGACARCSGSDFPTCAPWKSTVPHWVRGEAEFSVLSPWPQSMPTLALGGSVGTGTEGIEADAIEVKDLEALAALPAGAVKDKIVFFNLRMERTRDGSGYGNAVARARRRVLRPPAARRASASSSAPSARATRASRIRARSATRPTAPRIPAFAISNPDADALERQFASGKPVRLRIKSSSRDLPDAASANVDGRHSGNRSRQRNRDPRRAPRLLGSGRRRARRRRRCRDHDERRETRRRPRREAAPHDPRGAVRERGVRHLGFPGLLACAPGRTPTGTCSASRRTSARARSGAYLVGCTPTSCRRRPDLPGAGAVQARAWRQRGARRRRPRWPGEARHAHPGARPGRHQLLRRAPHRERHAVAGGPGRAASERRRIRRERLAGRAVRGRLGARTTEKPPRR